MKNIKLGWSLGYLDSFNTTTKKAVMEYSINHGIDNFRIYELFCKGWDVPRVINLCRFICTGWTPQKPNNYWKANLMICLSNYPYEWLASNDLSKLSPQQLKPSSFTNRFPPKGWVFLEYMGLLNDLVVGLNQVGILNQVTFEIGNEPDAAIFQWGSREDFINLAFDSVIQLNKSGVSDDKIHIGDFTSSLFRDKNYKDKSEWMRWIETDVTLFENIGLSHSFYWVDSSGLLFDVNNNSYPSRKFKSIVISEYGMFTSFNVGGIKQAQFQSDLWMVRFCNFLKFMYQREEPLTVYLHTLHRFPLSDNGAMAYYNGATPTNAALLMWKAYGVIKGGYEPTADGIRGVGKSIILSGGTYSVK